MEGFYATVARYYDAENSDKTDDLQLYAELAEEYGGPLLDIGCGTGRVMLHLAQAGYEMHGIDSEAAMLERAQRKKEPLRHIHDKLTFHLGNVLHYEFELRFKLVLLPYNGLMHFHEQSVQIELLQRLRRWTADDGLLVLDLPNAGETFATQDSDAISLERTFLDSESGHMIMQQAVSYLDRAEQLMRVTWIYDEIDGDGRVHRTVAPIVWRYFFYPEARLLLARAGFEVAAVYGDSDRSAFQDGCPRMIVLAKPV